MSSLPKTNVTIEEYEALDDASDVKLEYYQGQVYAMAGALAPHNRIAVNAIALLGSQLREATCDVFNGDQRVRTADGLNTYPDLSVARSPVFAESAERTLLNPVLIVEVLSKSTEGYDRSTKFESYRTIDSLQEYLLISSSRMRVDLFRRQADGQWLFISASKPDEVIELASCGCHLKLADVYNKVELTNVKPMRLPPEVDDYS